MSVPVKPMSHFVVAQNEKLPQKTASGLFIPESAQEKSESAIVKAVASDVKDINVGDRIVYKGYSSTTVKVEKDEYLIVKDEDILATIVSN